MMWNQADISFLPVAWEEERCHFGQGSDPAIFLNSGLDGALPASAFSPRKGRTSVWFFHQDSQLPASSRCVHMDTGILVFMEHEIPRDGMDSTSKTEHVSPKALPPAKVQRAQGGWT